MTNAATLAERASKPIAQIILASQPLPAAHYTSMTVTAVIAESLGTPGLSGWAIGTGPGGETFQAIFGELAPQVGEVWRCVAAEGGQIFLDDLIR